VKIGRKERKGRKKVVGATAVAPEFENVRAADYPGISANNFP
jgi:hypothetical protein